MAISGMGGYGGLGRPYQYMSVSHLEKSGQQVGNVGGDQGYGVGNTSTVSFLRNYASVMTNLMMSAHALSGNNASGAMDDGTITSSNTDVASATMDRPVRPPKEISLEVDRIARAQKNVSRGVYGSDEADSDMEFQINGAKTASVSVSAQNRDGTPKTNRKMLEEAARQINGSGAGVTAKVVEENGKVSLQVEGDETGTSNQFSVTGSLGAASGLEDVSVAAENAQYRVTTDGETKAYTSESNDIQLEGGAIGVTLKGAGKTDLSVRPDTEKLASAVEDLVKNYNRAVELLGKFANRGTGVARQLGNLTKGLLSDKQFEKLGIKKNKDGTLAFDKDAFKTGAEQDPDIVKDLLSGAGGLAQKVYTKALEGLSENSSSLVDREFQGMYPTNYPNGSKWPSPFFTGFGDSNPFENPIPGMFYNRRG